jgi:hypothetical protein
MPAQGNEARMLRRKTSDTATSLPDDDIELIFEEVEAKYSDYLTNRPVILQAAIVSRLKELVVAASKSVTYQLNETRINRSDTAKVLQDSLDDAQKELDTLLADVKPIAVGMGNIRRVPTQWKDTP